MTDPAADDTVRDPGIPIPLTPDPPGETSGSPTPRRWNGYLCGRIGRVLFPPRKTTFVRHDVPNETHALNIALYGIWVGNEPPMRPRTISCSVYSRFEFLATGIDLHQISIFRNRLSPVRLHEVLPSSIASRSSTPGCRRVKVVQETFLPRMVQGGAFSRSSTPPPDGPRREELNRSQRHSRDSGGEAVGRRRETVQSLSKSPYCSLRSTNRQGWTGNGD